MKSAKDLWHRSSTHPDLCRSGFLPTLLHISTIIFLKMQHLMVSIYGSIAHLASSRLLRRSSSQSPVAAFLNDCTVLRASRMLQGGWNRNSLGVNLVDDCGVELISATRTQTSKIFKKSMPSWIFDTYQSVFLRLCSQFK